MQPVFPQEHSCKTLPYRSGKLQAVERTGLINNQVLLPRLDALQRFRVYARIRGSAEQTLNQKKNGWRGCFCLSVVETEVTVTSASA